MVGDLDWLQDEAVWVLHCRITADVKSGGPVPPTTDWYLHVEDTYPYGQIVFYPAKVDSLVKTRFEEVPAI